MEEEILGEMGIGTERIGHPRGRHSAHAHAHAHIREPRECYILYVCLQVVLRFCSFRTCLFPYFSTSLIYIVYMHSLIAFLAGDRLEVLGPGIRGLGYGINGEGNARRDTTL